MFNLVFILLHEPVNCRSLWLRHVLFVEFLDLLLLLFLDISFSFFILLDTISYNYSYWPLFKSLHSPTWYDVHEYSLLYFKRVKFLFKNFIDKQLHYYLLYLDFTQITQFAEKWVAYVLHFGWFSLIRNPLFFSLQKFNNLEYC